MNYMCTFDLQGRTRGPSNWMSVKRDNNVFVMEFINNAFLPMRVQSGGRGRFNLYIYDQPLFAAAIDSVDLVMASIQYDASDAKICVRLSVGNMNSRVGSAYVEARVDGSVGIGAGRRMTLYTLDEIKQWAKDIGAKQPVGCGVSAMWAVGHPGFSISVDEHMIVCQFPNKLSFPITERGGDIEVIRRWFSTQVSELTQVFVRCWECTTSHAKFRVALIEDERVYVVDNIQLSEAGAQHDEVVLSSEELASMLYRRG